ncbi:hypothetical protein C1646_667887 [Rhizophagus diaphanus]|nr:hypothetical protein C1646_667887 [Rhizophagus diaphanus] [Rhizophagus sp. MUCL 43196]
MLLPWKYSKERLAKHPYCVYIIQMKKVICRCGKVIKLGHRYDETFLNIHVNGNCVRSMECEEYTNQNICNQCLSLKYNKILQNRIAIVKPLVSKLKHILKHYFENDPLKNYLKYSDLTTIWSMIKDNESNIASDVWIKLAEKDIQNAFDKKPVFEGFCNVMLQAVIQKEKNISTRNLKYTEKFINFLIILGIFSPHC